LSASQIKHFDLLRWFSIASLAALLPVAAITGAIFSQFMTDDALRRDAAMTADFIRNCVDVESTLIGLGSTGLARYLDRNVDPKQSGVAPKSVIVAREKVYKHLEGLPDVLLSNVYSRDGHIVWSMNQRLVGTDAKADEMLQKAIAARSEVSVKHDGAQGEGGEQRFVVQPKNFFTETYVPLLDANGQVVVVAEVYKEPVRLAAAVRRNHILVWCLTIGGGVLIWLVLFRIVARASKLLREQERQLVEAESRGFIGEMATALAHSLRNPLAGMRTSAELALMSNEAPVRKSAQDIITQVDFLSRWVRELLLYSRRRAGEAEPVDLCAVLAGVLESFRPSFERANVKVTWTPDPGWRPLVEGNTSLVTQALHGVITNAIEAMPSGGEVRIELTRRDDPPGVELVVTDTGAAAEPQPAARGFKPFQAKTQGRGLPMLKRAMERFGGFVTLSSAEKTGTQVRLHFRS
jgi:two-component system, NtrC family, sensor histidine kinase HydH